MQLTSWAFIALGCLLVVHGSTDAQADAAFQAIEIAPKLAPSKSAKVGLQFAANSAQYRQYMQKVLQQAQHDEEDMRSTSVAAGDMAMVPDEFKTQGAYRAYMAKTLANAPAPRPAVYEKEDPSMQWDLGEGTESRPLQREVANGKKTTQSGVAYNAVASRAVDGRTDTNFKSGSCTHTARKRNPWWQVDLGKTMNVASLQIWNRGDCCGSRLSNFEVRVGNSRKWMKNPKCGNRWAVPQGKSLKIPCGAGLQGQFVAVVIRATQALTLCEVKVFASDNPGNNAARGMPTMQSSTAGGGAAARAVDGRTATNFKANSCTHTKYETNPWWRVDLGKTRTVKAVQIWNRGDCCGSRLSNFEVRVGNNGGMWQKCATCGGKKMRWKIAQGGHKEIACGGQRGRYAFVVIRSRQVLTLCEVRVLTTFGKKGTNMARAPGTSAQQSSTGYGGVAKRAIDGNIDTNAKAGSCTHTHLNNNPWWSVNLGKQRTVGAVQVWNRGDCCGARLSNFEVRVGNEAGARWKGNPVCGGGRQAVPQGQRKTIMCGGMLGRHVTIVIRGRQYLSLCEVRVLPWKGSKKSGCLSMPLGVENRKVPNGDITASSFFGEKIDYGPNNARLNYRGHAWQALHSRKGQYLQVRLKKKTRITAIATQGSFTENKWVTKYKVKYFNGRRWRWYGRFNKMFVGNLDRNTVQKNKFKVPVKTNLIRVYPMNWKGTMSLRMELYGRNCRKKPTPGRRIARGKGVKCRDSRRRRSLKLTASPGYGKGVARLWYAASKGTKRHGTQKHTVYVSRGVDFRTESGSIYAGRDIVTSRYMKIQAYPGFGNGYARLWYVKRARKTFKANTVYLRSGDFRTQKGSMYAAADVQAGRYLQVSARKGFGQGVASFWFSASGKTKTSKRFSPNTVYLKKGDFATEQGSITAAKDAIARRYITINAFPKYGHGQARFWYVAAGKSPFRSRTVYLQSGDFATQRGSIFAKKDISASRYLRLAALKGHGTGEARLWYTKLAKNGFKADTLYLKSGNFRTQTGSIFASKDIVAGRAVKIEAYPGFGSGAAQLWFSKAGKAGAASDTLYLKTGDFRTQVGSLVAAKDLSAARYLRIASKQGHGKGEAKLWFSQSATKGFAAKTLYLKNGDFRTQTGSIFAGHSLKTARYLALQAFPGFGSGELKLWHCNKETEGFKANSLYLKSGDLRTQDGSIHAAKDLVAGRYVRINAKEGYGAGHTKLWYSQTGKGRFRSNSLYLSSGDFRTEIGSIHAQQDLTVGRFVKISAWPGHGNGFAKLWFSKSGGASGIGKNTLYLKTGHFHVQKGNLVAENDIEARRFVKIGAMPGYGSGHAKLWYSGSGKGKIFAKTLYVQSGDFRTQRGSIVSAKDVMAGGTLFGAALKVKNAYVPGEITAGHLFLGGPTADSSAAKGKPKAAAPAGLETTELLDVSRSQAPVEVGGLLKTMSDTNSQLTAKNSDLRKQLEGMMERLSMLESRARR
jgi:hypothetical protein